MERACFNLTNAQLAEFIAQGYTLLGGPFVTQNQCQAICDTSSGSSSQSSSSPSGGSASSGSGGPCGPCETTNTQYCITIAGTVDSSIPDNCNHACNTFNQSYTVTGSGCGFISENLEWPCFPFCEVWNLVMTYYAAGTYPGGGNPDMWAVTVSCGAGGYMVWTKDADEWDCNSSTAFDVYPPAVFGECGGGGNLDVSNLCCWPDTITVAPGSCP